MAAVPPGLRPGHRLRRCIALRAMGPGPRSVAQAPSGDCCSQGLCPATPRHGLPPLHPAGIRSSLVFIRGAAAPASPTFIRNLVFGGLCSRGFATSSPGFPEIDFGGVLSFDTLHFGLGFRAFANVSLGWSLIDSVNTRPLVGRNSTARP